MRYAAFIVLITLLFTPFITTAQTIHTEISDLSRGADVILTGKVIQKKSEWTTEGSSIYTRVTVQVDEIIKGNTSQQTVTIIHPGGEVDDIGELYTHIPTFSDDENVLLFARKHSNNTDYLVFEGEAGKITLYEDDHGELRTSQRKKVTALKEEIKRSLLQK
jgi:hypothetical protein